ncbi:hypothetical protein K431DRAFT_45215 [Polychaeton citri CBS 116435]|uniref:Uncharacterized protein n=1 Tax=Polychaeton citri CBS 116435 TaxID=1314669 RepID=A0A9P4UNM7_9PEZI|nr:hypothetical protein K431DRAFT_45215 [Polychaeton citri CBS 116435]
MSQTKKTTIRRLWSSDSITTAQVLTDDCKAVATTGCHTQSVACRINPCIGLLSRILIDVPRRAVKRHISTLVHVVDSLSLTRACKIGTPTAGLKESNSFKIGVRSARIFHAYKTESNLSRHNWHLNRAGGFHMRSRAQVSKSSSTQRKSL